MRSIRRIAVVMAGGVALSGCASDPAFWDGIAMGLNQVAYDLANQPVCTTWVDRFGIVQQHCAPAWQGQPQPYVIDSSYGRRNDRYRNRDRDRSRDRARDRDGDRHRGDRHDRRDRRDDDHRSGRRDPKRDR